MTSLKWQDSPEKATPSSHSNSNNPWFAVTIGLIGLIAGFGIGKLRAGNFPTIVANQPPSQIAAPIAQAPQQAPEPTSTDNLPDIDPKKDHIRGDISKATVAVVEYSDFECPFCKRHHPTMEQVVDTYKDDVVWVYRHFPLSFHANAQKEAEASECANELGGNDMFWKYTDAIFERTTAGGTGFPLENLAPLAKELGLNEATFKSCLDSGKYAQHVKDDMSGGSAAGVNGTPGNIVVNLKTGENKIISGAVPFSSFKTAIDGFLSSDAQAVAPSGDARVIQVNVSNWSFSPSTIRAKSGEKVTLELSGVDGVHGFAVPELDINEIVMPGKKVTIDLPTDKQGTFDFKCSLECGPGHATMQGQIVIEA